VHARDHSNNKLNHYYDSVGRYSNLPFLTPIPRQVHACLNHGPATHITMDPTYFTCTLGQAAELGNQQSQNNVNDFVEAQAKANPDRPAVGFPAPSTKDPKGDWTYQSYTFSEILTGSVNTAKQLLSENPETLSKRSTVGLLCPSTPEFLFIWLALMRLGHAVLLIAPQCQPAAIKNLCEQCEVSLLLHDEVYAELAKEAAAHDGATITAQGLPFTQDKTLADILSQPLGDLPAPSPAVQQDDVAYLHHTSGTSSGMPKPIPQPHRAAVCVLPSFESGKDNATFTTTPLYHGGIADLFRAWTSSALIWLFPGKAVPITATNVVRCLDVAAEAASQDSLTPPVKYFSSVPYVLQMLEADAAGLKHLQSMSIVGVGGAALPAEIGEKLVKQGVNLISRFGSAECGFLMSSHRDYSKDGEWQHLRLPSDAVFVRFEARSDNLSELVVLPGWPHMAKKNRDDGAFATADLFEPHATIEGAWKYHSRADSQLTLITGKKFDPAPLEATIATSDLVEDALIFGTGKPYPGALLFRSAKAQKMSDEEFIRELWPAIDKLNNESQDHARVSQGMLVAMSVLTQPLEKSSKGTILRGAAEKRFSKEIEGAYGEIDGSEESDVKDDDLTETIRSIVTKVAPRKTDLTNDTDLFSYGIDSVAGMQIRGRLRQLLPADMRDLPITVVEDYQTVSGLADYVLKRRHGQDVGPGGSPDDELALMRQLVEEYSNFQSAEAKTTTSTSNGDTDSKDDERDVVVLTGATGALGAHVLDQYRSLASVRKVYCLVRGADTHAAVERVAKALEYRKLRTLDDDPDDKVVVLPANLADDRLGLDNETYSAVAREVTIIMHVAWSVNFRMKLRSFVKDSIGGLSHLVSLALAAPASRPAPRIAFCSSVASVMSYPASTIPEVLVDDPAAASELGYSRSKWVAEHVCARANGHPRLAGRVGVFRVGQLAGASDTGVWNAKEAWPLMLSSVQETGALPDLAGEVLDWLPVDTAATAMIQGAERTIGSESESLEIYHVVNYHSKPEWSDLLRWVKERQDFETLSPAAWVAKLELLREKGSQHPALQLLEFWKQAYQSTEDALAGRKTFSTKRSIELPALRTVNAVDEEYFERLWKWIREAV
jgi:thioester reductase-like protein